MTRLDWEKAKRRELPVEPYEPAKRRRRNRKRAEKHRHQQELAAFVHQHRIVCFVCGGGHVPGIDWAKVGISKKGAWAIHADCVKHKR